MTFDMRVNEVFPAIQGEGPWTGRAVKFLRLTGCNLDCTWCDTPYTWDWTRFDQQAETHITLIADLIEELRYTPVVVSGGEPLLQTSKLRKLFDGIADVNGFAPRWQIETNGTRAPLDRDVVHVVSPKLEHSGVSEAQAIKPRALKQLTEAGAHFKFVVADPSADVSEVLSVVKAAGRPSNRRIWVMPEGQRYDEALWQAVAEMAIDMGWNFSPRLHSLLWGDERAR